MANRLQYSLGSGAIVVPAAAAGTIEVNITGPDVPFEIVDVTGIVVQANLVVANWAGLIYIKQKSSADEWMTDANVPFLAVVGDAKTPYVLPVTRVLNVNTPLTVKLWNSGAGTATIVYLSFNGWKLV